MTYLEDARKAVALADKGKTPIEIKIALGLRYSKDANALVNCGRTERTFVEPKLTKDEMTLILSIATSQRAGLERGDTCSPKLKYVGGMFWPRSRSETVARKRLGSHRRGEDESKRGTGLGLLYHYHGGYVQLTRAGWSLVHQMEARHD